jgi:lipid II:glycine glycyltransferase (peptidoglycan interpeptide bridge formation enzyme)
VYGYAGPVSSAGPVPAQVVEGFQAALRDELVRRRVVAVFSRLHPLLSQRHLIAGLGETGVVGPTVSVDLTLADEAQWGGYNKGTRRLIRRATEAGITCVHDLDLDYLGEWADLYRETMERLGASSSYYFDADYFRRMVAELRPVLHLFVALVDGRVAAAGLFTLCRGIVQAHLGGSRQAFASMSPGRVVDDTARRWAHEAGARVFHLGGGVGGRQDSLFQYKAGFSDRRHQFATWRWIVDEAAYADLCERHGAGTGEASPEDSDFFPAYRRSGDVGR